MQQIILILHVAFALALIVLILLQQGKGATVGASFGAGASQTIFGSQGAGSFMMKITAFFALLFFITSLALGHFANSDLAAQQKTSILSNVEKISQMQSQEQNAAENAAMQINSSTQLPAAPQQSGNNE